MTPTSIGLTKPPGISLTHQGATIAFTINEPNAAGNLVEVLASSDVFQGWLTIASKRGTAAWSGVASVALGTPLNGQIPLTVLDSAALSNTPRKFYRVKVSPL